MKNEKVQIPLLAKIFCYVFWPLMLAATWYFQSVDGYTLKFGQAFLLACIAPLILFLYTLVLKLKK